MKTLNRKILLPAVALLIFTAFFQNVKAGIITAVANNYTLISNHVAAADTPRLVYKKQRRKKIDKDIDREEEKLEDGIDENVLAREHQEFLRLKDPHLSIVPVTRLIEAKQVKEQLARRPVNNLNNLTGNAPPPLNTLQWNERGPNNVGGRTRALIFDLKDSVNGYKKVFAGGVGGGLWFTSDITATPVQWNKVNDFFDNIAISCIAQNPANPLEIYAGTGEGFYNGDAIQGLGVWKSADGGSTWARLTSTTNFTQINSILVDKSGGVYIAGVGFGIEKSSNGGTTFNQVYSGVDGADLQLAANGDIYAAAGVFSAGHVLFSDYGVNGANVGNLGNWVDITPAPNGTMPETSIDWWRIKLCVAPGNANIVYALFEGLNTYSLSSLQKYNKATNTWTVKTIPGGTTFNNGQAWYSIAAAVDPNNENVLYAGSLDAGRSVDGGSTWHTVTQWYVGQVSGLSDPQFVHADHHAYVFAPGSSDRFLMGTDGGIFYTQNASNNTAPYAAFTAKNNGYNVTQFYSVALHPTNYNFALAGAQDNSTQEFSAAGINSTTSVIGGDGAFSFIDQLNGNVQIGSYVYSNYYFSTDGGASFNSATSSNYGQFINPTDYDSKLKSLYAGSASGYYFRINSVPSTSDVQYVHVNGFNSANVMAVTVAPVTANRVFFGLDNGTVVRVDNANVGTENASVVLSPNPSIAASVSCIAVDPSAEDHMLVSYFNYGVVSIFETKNASAATPVWTQVEGNLPDMPVRWIMFHPEDNTRALIATELGVWTTDALNGASTAWSPTNSGLANTRVDMMKYRAADRTLAAATHGRGLFTTTLPLNAVSSLAGLTISSGTLSPVFSTSHTTYVASVANATVSVTVTPTVTDPLATVKVNGATVASGTASASLPLAIGTNVITILVKAQNGVTTTSYKITVTRTAPAVATLSNLALSNGILNPAFASATTGYTASVLYNASSIKITPTVTDPDATIKVNGTTVASGSASGAIPLNTGTNVITTVVTASNGTTTKSYTVTVTRQVPSTNAVLTTVALTPKITLVSTTGPGYHNYTVAIPNNVPSIQVTSNAQDTTAVIKVNGQTVASGAKSPSIPLKVGSNVITIVVTAQDGVTIKNYIITATRAGTTIATLSNLVLSNGTLSPVFAAATTGYTATVPYSTPTVTVTPTATDPDATIKVNGTTVAPGSASGPIALSTGANTLTTVVTASDGTTTKSYTVTVTRQPPSTNALLTTVALTPKITLVSTTGPGYHNYTVAIPNNVPSIQVTSNAQDTTAVIKVNGQTVASGAKSPPIPLKVGSNVITIVVTAQDGVTVKNYIITATRAGTTIATLANLVLSTGTLSPVFATATTGYTASVSYPASSIKITPTVTDPDATVKVNGTIVASGSASGAIPLSVGANTITTVVTASNGTTTKSYTVTVTRQAPSTNAVLTTIALTPKITLVSTTGPGYHNYTVAIPNNVPSIQITSNAQDTTAVIKVNGQTVASGAKSPSIPLKVGSNVITVAVTAQDGVTVKNYIITATRAGTTIATLSNLVLSTGTLSPAFATATTGYTATVPYAPSSISITPTAVDPEATIKVNGTTVASGSASGAVALSVGVNTITTVVTASNGTNTKSYTVTVTRQPASTNALLSTILLTPKTTLTVTTGPGYRNYTASVPNSIGTVQVTANAQDATATIKVNGMAVATGVKSQAIPLNVGSNVITTIVAAQDGATTKSYIITVTRAAASMAGQYVAEAAESPAIDGIIVHQGLSPNGDGDNDVLTIDGITSYPDNSIVIMSRSGKLIFETKAYNNTSVVFDGHSSKNGKLQKAGTYFYKLDYKAGNKTKHKTGFILLKY